MLAAIVLLTGMFAFGAPSMNVVTNAVLPEVFADDNDDPGDQGEDEDG